MPFLSHNTHKLISGNGINSNRKEQDALKSPCRKTEPANSMEKASVFTFWHNRRKCIRKYMGGCIRGRDKGRANGVSGSITIETALVLPLFFLALLCLVYRMEVLAVQTNVKAGLRSAGKEIAKEAALIPVVSPGSVSAKIVEAVGTARLERSLIQGGSSGIDCSKTWLNLSDGKLHLSAVYTIKIPVPVFSILGWEQEETLVVKTWTGYTADTFGSLQTEETVYITETGVVYHKSPHCRYLDLSIRPVPADEVGGLRNEYGSKYSP